MFGKILGSLEQPSYFSPRLGNYILHGISFAYKHGFILFLTLLITAPSLDENLVWVQLSKMKYNYLGGKIILSFSEEYTFA